MSADPTPDELLSAIRLFIEGAASKLHDRDVFLARVAVNAVEVVRREISQGPEADQASRRRLERLLRQEGDVEHLTIQLCEAIRTGALEADPSEVMDHVRAEAIARVRIDQPGYSGLKAALEPLRASGPDEAQGG